MKLIEKIEISYFRSFSGKTLITECVDLNVFSGKNDCGKSNILKALNLFFSDEKVDFYNYLNFVEDFSKKRDEVVTSDQIKGKKIFSVRVLFNRMTYNSTLLPDRFWVEKTWDKQGDVTRKTRNNSGKLMKGSKVEATTTMFLKNINFQYVPAIKDAVYYDFLKKEYLKSLQQKIGDITQTLTEQVNQESDIIMREFTDFAPEVSSPTFGVSNFEIDFSNFLEVKTEGDGRNISLSRRGDGIQAKFIPQILNGIARNMRHKFIVWGFEEPENSLEYRNAQMLAESLETDHAGNKQIFLTTHSFVFTSLRGNRIAQYRVYKDDFDIGTKVIYLRQSSQGELIPDVRDVNIGKLEEELGIVNLNNDLEKLYHEREGELKLLVNNRKEMERYRKPILFVEDQYPQIYKIAWLKIHDIACTRQNVDVKFDDTASFLIVSGGGANGIAGALRQTTLNNEIWDRKKVCGLFDFDKEGSEQFHSLKYNSHWSNEVLGEKGKGYYRKRDDHPCFYAMLLPIPPRLTDYADLDYVNFANYVEVENLIDDDYLVSNYYVDSLPAAGGVIYRKMKNDKKPNLWKRLILEDKALFVDFVPLFDSVERMFADS